MLFVWHVHQPSKNAAPKDGFSALHLASVHGNLEACRLLLRAKTDLDAGGANWGCGKKVVGDPYLCTLELRIFCHTFSLHFLWSCSFWDSDVSHIVKPSDMCSDHWPVYFLWRKPGRLPVAKPLLIHIYVYICIYTHNTIIWYDIKYHIIVYSIASHYSFLQGQEVLQGQLRLRLRPARGAPRPFSFAVISLAATLLNNKSNFYLPAARYT